jgi:hypothetical protein
MTCVWIGVAVVAVAWALAQLKRSRPDGDLLRSHPYRRLFWFITPSRSQATVTYDTAVDVEELLPYLAEAGPAFGAHLTHAVVAACFTALAEVPRMNRFVTGQRLYQRRGEWLTFSMKRKRLDADAKLAMVKLALAPGETFADLVRRIDLRITDERTDKVTREDQEYGLFDALPNPALRVIVYAARWLDEHHLLPGWFVEGDGLFTSAVVANLGSLGMAAGHHHLYEWGNCPLFLVVGAVESVPVVVDGQVVVRRHLPLKWTFDERIDDGLNARKGIDAVVRVLSRPRTELGCLPAGPATALDRGRPPPR